MISGIAKVILRLLKWKVKGNIPHKLLKYVIIVIPHTSNWDFPLGILLRTALRIEINFVAKSILFNPPFGWIFSSLGGYPIDRSKKKNYVNSMVAMYKRLDKFALCIAPEGTRKRVERLKSGFYYIAHGAGVPIILCKFDYGSRTVTISEPFYPTGNKEKDFEFINNYYAGVKGKIPQFGYGYTEK